MNIWQIILIVLNLSIGCYMVFSVMKTLVELTYYMKDNLKLKSDKSATETAIIITIMLLILVAISFCPILNLFIGLAWNIYIENNKDTLFVKYKEAYLELLNSELE